MRVLLVGLGNIGLGLIAPVFNKAGYELIGTDANKDRLGSMQNGYFLQTPNETAKIEIEVLGMEELKDDFDLVITSVGRRNVQKVADWFRQKRFSAPVFLAENLPEPIDVFPIQIPIVVDRICPRIIEVGNTLSVVAEDYYRIVTLENEFTLPLTSDSRISLEKTIDAVEARRRKKLFTVNTAHVIVAVYGKEFGHLLVEEAIENPEIIAKVVSALTEVGRWLDFDEYEAKTKAEIITKRFSAPLSDRLDRIIGNQNAGSGNPYIDIPLKMIESLGFEAPTLKETQKMLSKLV